MLTITSFNINSIRARPPQVEKISEKINPDIIGLQEVKVQNHEFPHDIVEPLGYKAITNGQKSYHGVAILTKVQPENTIMGFPGDDYLNTQARLIHSTYKTKEEKNIHILNGYFPQGESQDHLDKFPFKRKFYSEVIARLKNIPEDDYVVVIGDMNIAPTDLDIAIGENNAKRWLKTKKCCFLPEEREWMQEIFDLGYIDSHRYLHPEDLTSSWFDYRSKGFDDNPKRGLRIDLLLVSKNLKSKIIETDIDLEIRSMEKPSDHAPVTLKLDIELKN